VHGLQYLDLRYSADIPHGLPCGRKQQVILWVREYTESQ
jgi:hypothetical protein